MFRVVASNIVMRFRHGHIIDLLKTCKHSTLKAETEAERSQEEPKKESERMSEFRKKLHDTVPDEEMATDEGSIRQNIEDDPLPPWPDNTNPHTGEIGGPKGPEPTRYGDWERKGRVTDF